MNICLCGYQPGAARHAADCPYPLFRGTESDCLAWEYARDELRAVDPAILGIDTTQDGWFTLYKRRTQS